MNATGNITGAARQPALALAALPGASPADALSFTGDQIAALCGQISQFTNLPLHNFKVLSGDAYSPVTREQAPPNIDITVVVVQDPKKNQLDETAPMEPPAIAVAENVPDLLAAAYLTQHTPRLGPQGARTWQEQRNLARVQHEVPANA